MRILVCGGRNYQNYTRFRQVMTGIASDGDTIISGGARGADTMARIYAEQRNFLFVEYLADWKRLGKAAGRIRNKEMLERGKPDLVVAFPGGAGTAHMVAIARRSGVAVREVFDA